MTAPGLRRGLGLLAAAFGLLHLIPTLFVWLSSGGPAPVLISARAWSVFFYAHFIVLVASGVGLLAYSAARSKIFHGGPLIDFLLGVTGFMIVESLCAHVLRLHPGASVFGLAPGAALLVYGLRLSGGAPLLR